MVHELRLPDVGEGVAEGEIVRWLVAEGQEVKEDDPVVEVLTDKADVEIPSPIAGRLSKIVAQPGRIVKVGEVLALIEGASDELSIVQDAQTLRVSGGPPPSTSPSAMPPPVPRPARKAPDPQGPATPPAPGDVLATPSVRKLAKDFRVDLTTIKGTGPGGRVTEDDVERAAGFLRPDAAVPRPGAQAQKPQAQPPAPGIEPPAAPKAKAPAERRPSPPPAAKVEHAAPKPAGHVAKTPAAPPVVKPPAPPAAKAEPSPSTAPPPSPAAPAGKIEAPPSPPVSKGAAESAAVPAKAEPSPPATPAAKDEPSPAPPPAAPAGKIEAPAPPPSPKPDTRVEEPGPSPAVKPEPAVAPTAPAPSRPAPALPEERVPFRGRRRMTARRMTEAKATVPHALVVDEADATALLALRERAREAADREGVKITVLPFVIRAVVGALKGHPGLNAALDEAAGEVVLKKHYDIGIAVDAEDGLVVPVVRGADRKTIVELARDIERLSEAVRSGTVSPEDVRGSTFTVTSIGSIGGLFSYPIINVPDAAILGVHRIAKRLVVRDDAMVIRDMVYLSLSFDHRIVDGGTATRFLNEVIRRIESPGGLDREGP